MRLYQRRGDDLVDITPEPNNPGPATATTLGLVRPDGVTITGSGGFLMPATSGIVVEGQAVAALEPPRLVSSHNAGHSPSPVLFTVSAKPSQENTDIESFLWTSSSGAGSAPATDGVGVVSVPHSLGNGGTVSVSVAAQDTFGLRSSYAEFSHVVVTTPSRHGELLSNASGTRVAVIIGSFVSNGAEPWDVFGTRMWIAVALAQFRTRAQAGWYGASIPGADAAVNLSDVLLASDNTSADSSGYIVSSQSTEEHMNSMTVNDAVQDSRRKTDAMLSPGWPSSYPPAAAQHCRGVIPKLSGTTTSMDLPRLAVLMRVYQSRDVIDSLDPTASSYASYKLSESTWGFGSNFVHSSSIYDGSPTTYVRTVRNNGDMSYRTSRSNSYGVIPCLEIPAI